MTYILQSGKGILSKRNGQWMIFDTPADALRHIEDHCGNSRFIRIRRLKSKSN